MKIAIYGRCCGIPCAILALSPENRRGLFDRRLNLISLGFGSHMIAPGSRMSGAGTHGQNEKSISTFESRHSPKDGTAGSNNPHLVGYNESAPTDMRHWAGPAVGESRFRRPIRFFTRRGLVTSAGLILLLNGAGFRAGAAQTGNTRDQDSNSLLRQAQSLLSRMVPDDCDSPSAKDLAALISDLSLFHRIHDTADEQKALAIIGTMYTDTGEFGKAIPYLKRALDLHNELKGITDESRLMTLLAGAYNQEGKPQEALGLLRESLDISTRQGNDLDEADALTARGEATYSSNPDQALKDFERALSLSERAHALKTQAVTLNDQGYIYRFSNPDKARQMYEEALAVEERIHDCRDKADTLSNLASFNEYLGKGRTALDFYTQALKVMRQTGDRGSEARTLHALAKLYEDVGDFKEALSLFRQALQIEQQTGNVDAEGPTLGGIAAIYSDIGKPYAARLSYLQAFSVLQKTRNTYWQIAVLNNLGAVEADLRLPKEARAYYNRAVKTALVTGDSDTPAYSAWGIGSLEESDALASYFRALRMALELDRPDLEGLVDASLMNHFRKRHQADLAIFFGKQAVDKFQAIRANLAGANDVIVSSLLQNKSPTYRTLAEILIDEGRLIEAQQILDMLKITQYSDYAGGQPSELITSPTRNTAEATYEERYQQLSTNLLSLNHEFKKLQSDGHKSTDREYVRVREALSKAEIDFDTFLRSIDLRPVTNTDVTSPLRLTGAASTLQKIIEKDPGTVALYTLEGKDEFRTIVITGSQRFSRSYPISQKVLEQKCQDFLENLKNDRQESKDTAQDLFKIIFGPVQRDLEQADATTIVWYLDGALRYIPISALLDPATGKYLIERFSIVNYTPLNYSMADIPNLKDARAIAMGTSRSFDDVLGPLPNVKQELSSIVTDPGVPGSHGILPGTILLDEKFTETAMEGDVRSQAIIHIASHFVLMPGDDDFSFLLLGGKDQEVRGYHLSVSDFKKDQNLHMAGTELVTLSACQTGAENKRDDGLVMEGMSESVLDKRAKAVISTLWEVNDQSTAAIMADFYKLWVQSGGKLTKAEALRQAQLNLLHASVKPKDDATGRGAKRPANSDASGGYAHPYYWAPFVLMGNWL